MLKKYTTCDHNFVASFDPVGFDTLSSIILLKKEKLSYSEYTIKAILHHLDKHNLAKTCSILTKL